MASIDCEETLVITAVDDDEYAQVQSYLDRIGMVVGNPSGGGAASREDDDASHTVTVVIQTVTIDQTDWT